MPDDWTVTVAHRQPDLGISIGDDGGTEATASVVTRHRVKPRDIERLPQPDGPVIVAASWLSPRSAVDLLTGTARMPAEGQALIDWMRRDPSRWQEVTLRG